MPALFSTLANAANVTCKGGEPKKGDLTLAEWAFQKEWRRAINKT